MYTIDNVSGAVLVAAVTLIIHAIGFVFLTKNHLAHIQRSLDRIEAAQKDHAERISYLEGVVGD